jgi:hypothetical protein
MFGDMEAIHMYSDFQITKREVLVSIIIIAIMLLLGIVIHSNINDGLMLEHQKYNTALQIENDSDLFAYGMKTNIGNAFVYGDLKAVDTVTYPEIGGEYMHVEKVKERYTRHTRTVTKTRIVNGQSQTYTETETYWTWDRVGSEDKQCKEISFCGVVFDSNKINLPSSSYITTIKESSHIRYKYYGTETEFTGTIFAELKDNTIPDNTGFYKNDTIEDVLKSLKSNWQLVVFWIVWILLTGGLVVGFYYIDNYWLEDY